MLDRHARGALGIIPAEKPAPGKPAADKPAADKPAADKSAAAKSAGMAP
jgi:hypothetical protein